MGPRQVDPQTSMISGLSDATMYKPRDTPSGRSLGSDRVFGTGLLGSGSGLLGACDSDPSVGAQPSHVTRNNASGRSRLSASIAEDVNEDNSSSSRSTGRA